MDMGKILENSVKYPVSNWKRLLIFGIIVLIYQFSLEILMRHLNVSPLVLLLIIPFFIAYFLIQGYQLRAIGTTIGGEMEAPKLNNWLKMFVDGLKIFIVGLVYGIVPMIVIFAGLGLLFAGTSSIRIVGAFILLLGAVILLIMTLLMIMGISNMAYHGEIEAALRFGEIKEKIKKIGWLNYIVMLLILGMFSVILTVVSVLISLIPILGLALTCLTIEPYIFLFISRAYALIYLETVEDEPGGPLTEMKNFPGRETNPN